MVCAKKGHGDATVIPGAVTARVSVRIVPDQDVNAVAEALVRHLEGAYAAMNSPNTLAVAVEHTADWWLGELDGPWFRALESAVRDEWAVDPLHIREGGVSRCVEILASLLTDRESVHPVCAVLGEGVQVPRAPSSHRPELGATLLYHCERPC
jgi:hypothetical protein